MTDAPKLSIVLMSPEMEKLHAGAMLGTVAAASGMQVSFFVTMEALKMFLKETVEKQDFDSSSIGDSLLDKKVDLYYKMLEDGKDLGDLKVFGCSLVVDVMGWEKEDMLDVIDDVIGVSAFFGMAEGSQVMVI